MHALIDIPKLKSRQPKGSRDVTVVDSGHAETVWLVNSTSCCSAGAQLLADYLMAVVTSHMASAQSNLPEPIPAAQYFMLFGFLIFMSVVKPDVLVF